MKLRDTIMSAHAATLEARLHSNEDFARFHTVVTRVADQPYILPSYDDVNAAIAFLRTLSVDSSPVRAYLPELQRSLSRYTSFCGEAQNAILVAEHLAKLASAANLFGVTGKYTMPWREVKVALGHASSSLDAYLHGESTALSIFASHMEDVFELALACSKDSQSDFYAGDEAVAELLRVRDSLFVKVLLEES